MSTDRLDQVVGEASFAAAEARRATLCRDEAIRAAVEQGVSRRQVARAVGLSHSGVARIIARKRGA